YAFGSLLEKTGSSDTSFRFTGRDWDAESGLYHLRARAYDARVGRFLQQDPWPRTPGDPRLMALRYLSGLADAKHPLPGAAPIMLSTDLFEDIFTAQFQFFLNPLALNHYSYVYNSPLLFKDPLGLERSRGRGFEDAAEIFARWRAAEAISLTGIGFEAGAIALHRIPHPAAQLLAFILDLAAVGMEATAVDIAPGMDLPIVPDGDPGDRNR
ncbi:MAG: RHS repeat-associated core domain-containing protein, partial [Candidatus Omnitrophica bacterium]|nr:RHS repeat-associated core domain-containing protein [Candidatus Omnitrophota bacterium]